MRAWHVHPALWMDVDEEFIRDIIRYINQSDAVRAAVKDGVIFGEPDAYDPIPDSEDILRL